ncbi:efflux RND transporter permease subunit [Sphingobacterium sp. CZ-2]|uniref:efflux RND transporter permease subunit n=1 Tax=Sphingobacterium sp. CZ-2 TaxID=2557994 RepID=UPI00106F8A00|nr:efflux RND transporter permease subunit [Sphingobacterium sp. CZ-2]QBR11574.1 efflux RND transporter permease subunit [Sphingobacterium sp. CZ-2]
MIKKFIERPVFSTVISIIIVVLGVLGLMALPTTQYPDIAPPTVKITANFPGADAMTVMRSVITPIEEQVNGVENMTYVSSSATNDGTASIDVFFELGTDPDIAAMNVQNRVNRALPLLPQEATRSGVVTQKQENSALMFIRFYATNPSFDQLYIENYIAINIIPAIKRIKGVADAPINGAKTYAMRIWLLPEKLAAYGLEPEDVIAKINSQSREAAAGQIGSNAGQANEYVIRYKGRFESENEYENIIIKALGNGEFLRLKDVADVSFASQSYSAVGETMGYVNSSFGVFQSPGSNAQEVNKAVLDYLKSIEPTLPDGLHWLNDYDLNTFLEGAIDQVVVTLIEAFILVFLVVLLFLQDFRSTLIPAIAVPVSIVGSFFFLNLFGFSLNLLTLFALVLAIGIVVDDAIVVVEAVHAKLEKGKQDSRSATVEAMGEISGAIVSITLVLGAVFVPVTFISGPAGVFYQQFGITLMVAIFISAVNALTLTPMLCALFLKYNHTDKAYADKNMVQKFNHKFNTAFHLTTKRYAGLVKGLIRKKWIVGTMFIAAIGLIIWANSSMPKGFVPLEDRGVIFINVELPPGASMERTYSVMKELEGKVKDIPGVDRFSIATGASMFSGTGSNNASAYIHLPPFEQRKGDEELGLNTVVRKLNERAKTIPEANIVFFAPASVRGFGNSAGFSMVLLDRGGNDIADVDKVARNFIVELEKRPEIDFVQTSFNVGYPQYEMIVNAERAEESGVEVSNILSAMQGYIGGFYAADFTRFGKPYRVMVQSLPESRMDERLLEQLTIRTASGEMAPISQFVSLERTYGPQVVKRFNLFTSVQLEGANAPGYSTGDAIAAFQEVAAQSLPADYTVDYAGLTREEIAVGNQTLFIFLLCVMFIYLLLSAQYESFIQPLTVIFSLPFGIMGAFVGQHLAGLENNIYFQVALIMLVGLLAKNAILIVEFAQHRRNNGETIAAAAINAAKARLRPILMTSLAFIAGMLPLVFSNGMGEVGNRSIGTGAAAGLLIGTVCGVLVIPVLFVIFQWLQEKVKPIRAKEISDEQPDNV